MDGSPRQAQARRRHHQCHHVRPGLVAGAMDDGCCARRGYIGLHRRVQWAAVRFSAMTAMVRQQQFLLAKMCAMRTRKGVPRPSVADAAARAAAMAEMAAGAASLGNTPLTWPRAGAPRPETWGTVGFPSPCWLSALARARIVGDFVEQRNFHGRRIWMSSQSWWWTCAQAQAGAVTSASWIKPLIRSSSSAAPWAFL